MIDFKNGMLFKLKPIPNEEVHQGVKRLLIDGEEIISAFQTIRDQLVFTNKRIISVNVQGITGKKIDFTSIPYNKIQTFSIESAGTLDLDTELDIFISSIGKIRFEIKAEYDIVELGKVISEFVLR